MPTISNTPRPAYIYDAANDQWVPVGFGPHTHAVTDVTNAFNTTTVTTKGDLVVAAGSNNITRLPAGSNGQSLVADSTTTTGLRWQDSVTAGKNALINGAFDIWQRGTTFSPGTLSFGPDRWKVVYDDSTSGITMSRVDIGDLNIGFKYALSMKNTVGTKANANIRLQQAFETVDTHMMRGKTYTLSFYARKVSGASARITHFAGWVTTESNSFGSSDETQVVVPTGSLTTTFQRFSQTFVASTNTSYNCMRIALDFQFLTSLNDELQVTGVQLEVGSVATPFSRAGGTIQGELAACQRYYWRNTSNSTTATALSTLGTGASATLVIVPVQNPVTMRVTPTAIDYASIAVLDVTASRINATNVTLGGESTSNTSYINVTVASGIGSKPYIIYNQSAATGYIGLSAEL